MHRYDRSRQALAVALAALAGFVDASGFVANGGYFISFMSGNTTRLAVDLARDTGAAWRPAGLIAGFVLGVTLGSVVAAVAGERRKVAVLGTVAALLTLAGMGAGVPVLAQTAMVLAMGAMNATFQRDGEVAVGLTYMTGALVRAGQGLAGWLLGRANGAWRAHMALWLGLACGGIAGALSQTHWGGATQWLAAGWAGTMALLARRLRA
ncbi:MAG TPA: YoaK family protein [Novosphingobium sp.]|nr:YoaK family protein [Novosphingobium sp.]